MLTPLTIYEVRAILIADALFGGKYEAQFDAALQAAWESLVASARDRIAEFDGVTRGRS
jgi:hypothetical protein